MPQLEYLGLGFNYHTSADDDSLSEVNPVTTRISLPNLSEIFFWG